MIADKMLHNAVKQSAKKILGEIAIKYECGWFDGGCYTFSSAISELIPNSIIYHVSRNTTVRDHAVVYLPNSNNFIDADGIQTEKQLINKMKEIEFVNVTVCEPFKDIDNYPIYWDIKKRLIKEVISYSKND